MRNHLIPSAIALAAALSATPALARPMTEVDLATMNRVAAPAASPDGRWLVYQVTATAPETYKRSTGLWIIDRTAKSGKPPPIADAAGKNENASAFSPDRQLNFVSGAAGSDQVWRVAVGPVSGPAKQVTDDKDNAAGIQLSTAPPPT